MTQRMPAEWAPHERTVICWPARDDLYGRHLAAAEAAHALLANTIAPYEPVTMIASPRSVDRALEACGLGVDVVELAIDDAWFRDSGPTYVIDGSGKRVALDWVFNSWGNKFLPYDDDATIARRWAERNGDATRSVPIVLEGGSIAVDGEGTLVTTQQCLLNPNRNPDLNRVDIETTLERELGVSAIVWLPFGLALDDDTDGHVDNVAAFSRPGVLMLQGCDDPAEEDSVRAGINRRCAQGSIDARGRAIEVVEIPVLPFVEVEGARAAVPYLNFYVANGLVVVPVCGHPADADMVAMIAEQFPGRDTVALDIGAILAHGGGGIHCITQQVPRR